jgi:muramoyltetrapeptide carboxypeptidase
VKTKPRALRKGDRIGLIAPSGPLAGSEQIDRAAAMLRSFGFEPVADPGCASSYGYLAGSDQRRAAELMSFFADDSVAGILCMKGGYGTPRILDAIDWLAVAKHPKVFVGYSDITALHLALNQLCNLATFHGPMGISDTLLEDDDFSVRSWLAAVTSTAPLGIIENPSGSPGLETLVGGQARGELVGGNLSLIAATMGTPYEIDARGKILFFEDTGERPYRIDRMLTTLRLAGKFDECAGIVLGDWNDCGPAEGKPSLSLRQVFEDVIAPSLKPCVYGLKAGHCSPTLSLPFGVEALLDADSGRLEILEAAAVP